ncbi:unnamed protein product [Aphanomyces euteiches]
MERRRTYLYPKWIRAPTQQQADFQRRGSIFQVPRRKKAIGTPSDLGLSDYKEAEILRVHGLSEEDVVHPQAGLEKKDVKILVDRFMTKGFKIDRDIYNEGYLAGIRSDNDKVGLMFEVFAKHGPGVYTMQTEDTSKMGHFWTVHSELGAVLVKSEDPPRGVKAYEELYQQVNSIRKFVPRLPKSKKRKHSNNN